MRHEMRQVDRDELAWKIYSAMRHWSATRIRDMFSRSRERRDHAIWVGAEVVAARVPELQIYSANADRPLDKNQVRAVVAATILSFPGAIGDLWLSRIYARAQEARAAAASLIVDALDPYEVLVRVTREGTHILGDRPALLKYPDIRAATHALAAAWP